MPSGVYSCFLHVCQLVWHYLHVCSANYVIEFVKYVKKRNRLLLQTRAACQNNKIPGDWFSAGSNMLLQPLEIRNTSKACSAHMIRRVRQSRFVLCLIPPSSGPDTVRTQKLLTESCHQHFPLVCTRLMINRPAELQLLASRASETLSNPFLTMSDGLNAWSCNWLIRQLKTLKGTWVYLLWRTQLFVFAWAPITLIERIAAAAVQM